MRSGTWFEDLQNPYHDDKVIAACGLFGVLDTSGAPMTASDTVRAIANMHDRNNGLGGGLAVYGLYPDRADLYAIHVMYMRDVARPQVDLYAESLVLAPGESIEPHQVRLSNGPAMQAMLREQGYADCDHAHLVDNPDILRERIAGHLDDADVLIEPGQQVENS